MKRDLEQAIVDSVLDALSCLTGISGVFSSSQGALPRDGQVQLSRSGEASRVFAAEVKGVLRRDQLPQLLYSMRQLPQPSILLARYVSERQADELIEHGVNFADAAGNVHIAHGEWFVLVKGRPRPAPLVNRPRPLGASVWKVAYTLLRAPGLGAGPIRSLAREAGVSPGTASKAIQALDDRGWISNLGHERIVLQPRALWNAWETGWLDRLASKQFVTRAVAPTHPSLQDWLDDWRKSPNDDVFVGGELGAQLLGTDIIATTGTLHVRRWDASMVATLRLVPAETGPFTVREVFGTLHGCDHASGVAHPMLVRAELLSIVDERLDGSRDLLAERIVAGLPDAP